MNKMKNFMTIIIIIWERLEVMVNLVVSWPLAEMNARQV